MSILFKPLKLKDVEIRNRFIHSATYEAMSLETGEVSDSLVKRYQTLARGEIGLIIPGYMYINPMGRTYKYQTGIHTDDMIPGLKKIADAVHKEGGKIIFQIVHAGSQTTKTMIGNTPIAPSAWKRDPVNFVKPREMSTDEIHDVIRAFGAAAKRAVKAGADGIQLHAAHGYLISQFLSPFFNHRNDEWGGSAINRFRFLKEIILNTRESIPKSMPILVKLNANDYTPQEGVTPSLAATYATWLAELNINGLELSCGSALYSFMNTSRGDVPVKEFLDGLPLWKRPLGKLMLKKMAGKYDLEEGYNVEAAKMIKPVLGNVPLFVVGGLRTVAHMTEVLEKHYADGISMSRPFIREPLIVKKIKEGKASAVACVSCNRCLAAVVGNIPVQCYNKGLPIV
jgi:2,4-dienoyl-CoA reductase-like NADH-dependent reductase (Old Yellow Enzyme family)